MYVYEVFPEWDSKRHLFCPHLKNKICNPTLQQKMVKYVSQAWEGAALYMMVWLSLYPWRMAISGQRGPDLGSFHR